MGNIEKLTRDVGDDGVTKFDRESQGSSSVYSGGMTVIMGVIGRSGIEPARLRGERGSRGDGRAEPI